MGDNFINAELKRKFDKYALFIGDQDNISIDYLAAAVGISNKMAIAELQTMTILGYFGKDAYIDYYNKQLVLRHAKATKSAKSDSNLKADELINNIKNTITNNIHINSSDNTKRKAKKKAVNNTPVISQKPYAKKSKLTALSIFGSLFLISALSYIPEVLASYRSSFSTFLNSMIPLSISLFFAVLLLTKKHRLSKMNGHFSAYRAIIGERSFISLNDLASSAGVSISILKKDLEAFIEKGLLGKEAYIDHSSNNLILLRDAYTSYKSEDSSSEKFDDSSSVTKDAENQYYEIIKEIRELNDAIPDPDVSDRIYKIEEITSKIFRVVEEKPEKLPEIRSFMSYYLPTTLKLLRSYAMLDKQGVPGDNINATKENIEHVLDKIVKGFSQQLDQLFKSDYLDISTDIEVLETMMAKDGLSGGSAFQAEKQ